MYIHFYHLSPNHMLRMISFSWLFPYHLFLCYYIFNYPFYTRVILFCTIILALWYYYLCAIILVVLYNYFYYIGIIILVSNYIYLYYICDYHCLLYILVLRVSTATLKSLLGMIISSILLISLPTIYQQYKTLICSAHKPIFIFFYKC